MTTVHEPTFRGLFHTWLDHALSASIPPRAAAFVLNLYEGARTFDARIIATARFDAANREWTSDVIFSSGEDLFSVPRSVADDSWQDALRFYDELFTDYLATGRRADVMTSTAGAAIGFVDGDLIFIHPRKPLELVHAVFDYYDGVRSGVADYDGRPHAFRREFNEDAGDWSDFYRLKALTEEDFELVMTDWNIWTRWLAAFRAGAAALESHPALPEDKPMHDRIASAVDRAMSVGNDSPTVVWGRFDGQLPPDGELQVLWRLVSG